DIETRTKAILDGQGVLMSQYPMYYNFARQVGNKIKYTGYAGSCLYTEIDALIYTWEKRGLDGVILRKILLDVFGILL
ncbi:MAG: hypothetical protein NZ608_07795, partial [candidate division WOR-3 bacterium]|nr:hypothetical protein [candidate division WOR-3 bacterium]